MHTALRPGLAVGSSRPAAAAASGRLAAAAVAQAPLRRSLAPHPRAPARRLVATLAGGGEEGGGESEDPFGPPDGGGVVIPPEFAPPSPSGGAGAADSTGPAGDDGAALAAAVTAAASEYASAAAAVVGDDDPFGDQVRVFPRIKERDPYRRLGVGRDASFEEVQDARNYLYETYKRHERSREAIELAFDAILREKMKERQAAGFRPPRRAAGAGGKKGGGWGRARDPGAPRFALLGGLRDRLDRFIDPTASVITLINDGSIFVVFGLWAAWQRDPSFPMLATICYALWKLFDKRRQANPEGPFVGGSPIFGAFAATLFAVGVGLAASTAISTGLAPLLPGNQAMSVGLFALCTVVGLVAIYLR